VAAAIAVRVKVEIVVPVKVAIVEIEAIGGKAGVPAEIGVRLKDSPISSLRS
jgi:hypothetical protein